MPDACDALDRWIDAHFDDEVRFLQALVRVPTDTPPGDNAPHAERTAELLAAMGFAAERHPVPAAEVAAGGLASITNLIVRRRFGEGGPVIALNAHGDVVPPGEGWTHDPYGAEIAASSASTSAASASRAASVVALRSRLKRQRPGTTLIDPEGTSSMPTVPTTSGTAAARRSTKSASSATASAASRRRPIGVVPAWLAWPVTSPT
jgi:hypothetical protein